MSFANENTRALIPGHCLTSYTTTSVKSSVGLWEMDQNDLSRLVISPFGRSIYKDDVANLKQWFIKERAYNGEPIDFIKLAVVRSDLINHQVNHQDQDLVPIYIMDGQHRFVAMQELKIKDPNLNFKFYSEVKIVSNLEEIANMIKTQGVITSSRSRTLPMASKPSSRTIKRPMMTYTEEKRHSPTKYHVKYPELDLEIKKRKTPLVYHPNLPAPIATNYNKPNLEGPFIVYRDLSPSPEKRFYFKRPKYYHPKMLFPSSSPDTPPTL